MIKNRGGMLKSCFLVGHHYIYSLAAISFVVPKTRAWFALNQTYCQLENYYTEADFVSKKVLLI